MRLLCAEFQRKWYRFILISSPLKVWAKVSHVRMGINFRTVFNKKDAEKFCF